jgi:hypothetical protein
MEKQARWRSRKLHVQSTAKDLTVNLKFVPQEGVHSESPDLPPSMLRVEDGRSVADAMRIGKGTDDDDEVFSISAGSDVAAYVKDTLQSILTVKIARFFVDDGGSRKAPAPDPRIAMDARAARTTAAKC